MRAIFPASFDPITNGHLDIATRASRRYLSILFAESPLTHSQSEQ